MSVIMNSVGGPPSLFSSSQQQQPVQQPTTTAPPLPTPPENTQQFCLRWNSYPYTVASQIAELRLQEEFVDVTLACDGRQLKAHKLVLSACSPFFMKMFKSTPCQHPVIFLNNVGFGQLVALLEFMYAGEVNVSQVDLPSLLKTAEQLQVRGLADTATSSNSNNNNSNCPPPPEQQQQQPKQNISSQYEQMVGHQQPLMTNAIPVLPSAQLDHNQNGGSGIMSSMPPCSSSDMPNNNNNNLLQRLPSQQQMGSLPIVSTATTSNNNNVMSSSSNNIPHPKMEVGNAGIDLEGGGNKNRVHNEEEEEVDANEFEMLEALDQSKEGRYHHHHPGNGDNDMTDQLEDTGQIFPDDPLFDVGEDGDDIGNEGGGDDHPSEEESSEVSDDDDGECKEFTYQSDASYSQEGMNESDGLLNPNGDSSIAGPSGLPHHPGLEPGAIIPGKEDGSVGSSASARNRLSRSLWPPGIPYHGPQQCPYCTRVLSNVGNWRKHVLTMHFAREKIFKCRHCTSSFRTAEYLQKHYVRVHNYPQKMTRRKYVEPT